MHNLQSKIADIIRDSCQLEELSKNDYERAFADLGIDSLDVASIFLSIKEDIGFNVPDDEIDELNTVELIVKYLERHGVS